jgi:TfoX/Sxy family transcriptional regulator of competence genes
MNIPYPEFQAQLKAAAKEVAPSLELGFKAMFGGAGAYAYGQIFASLSDVGLALKLSPEVQAELLKVEGAKRLQYEPNMPPSKQYIVVPASQLKPKALGKWLKQSLEYTSTLPEKKRSPALPEKKRSPALPEKKRSPALPEKKRSPALPEKKGAKKWR